MVQEEYEKYLKRLEKARGEKASYMNNAKWFKFFSAIKQLDIFLPEAQAKCLVSDEIFPFRFDAGFNEKGVLDGSLGYSPAYYEEIEWIFIPAVQEYKRYNRWEKIKSTFEAVNLPLIVETLKKIGQYEFDIDERGLKLYGYR